MKNCCDAQYVMDRKENVFKITENSGYRDSIEENVIYYEEGPNEETNQYFHDLYKKSQIEDTQVTIKVCKDGECLGDYTIEEVSRTFKLKKLN